MITALRPEQARAKGLPEPTDANQHTGVKDPTQPFNFSFPDLEGKIVSNTDARFRNKVVLINITGSWCPNCHDEAGFSPPCTTSTAIRVWRLSRCHLKRPSSSATRLA